MPDISQQERMSGENRHGSMGCSNSKHDVTANFMRKEHLKCLTCGTKTTVEPPNKGHFGNRSFVLSSEVVPISEVHLILIYYTFISSLKCLKWVDNQLGH